MALYKQLLDPISKATSSLMIMRTSDNAVIPNNSNNRDWVAYQAWLALGNTPDPA